jgi:hypothetical protein
MPSADSPERHARLPDTVSQRILRAVDAFIANPSEAEAEASAGASALPSAVMSDVAAIEREKKNRSYRDSVLIQLAFGLEHGEGFNHMNREKGARGTAAQVGAGFEERVLISTEN